MIIGICGRVAAGKETLTQFLRNKGFSYFETSKLINEELIKLGLEITRKNQQDLADKLRKEKGVGVLMNMVLEKIEIDMHKDHIIDSLRNSGEAIFLRENVPGFILIGVDAPKEVRFKRIQERGKPSDPKTWEEFIKMDERDNFDVNDPLGQQTGKLLEMSDFVIVNDGNIENALKKVEEIWQEIEKMKQLG